MTIWEIGAGNQDFDTFDFANNSDFKGYMEQGLKYFDLVNSNIELIKTVSGKFADRPNFYTLMLNQKTVDILFKLIDGKVKLTPLNHNKEIYYVVEVINTIDALDEKKSDIVRFSDGKIMWLNNIVFKEELLLEEHIFCLPMFKTHRIFVSNSFKELTEKNSITNLNFIKP